MAIVIVIATTSCDSASANDRWQSMLESVGLVDVPPLPGAVYDIACDPSLGASCDKEHLGMTIDLVLHRAILRPGSVVRLWMIGATVEATVLLGEARAVKPSATSERGRHAEAERWVRNTYQVLITAATASFAGRQPRRSPLVESVTKIALADAGGLERELILITDARETAIADFECRRLPTDRAWQAILRSRALLVPESLTGARVSFTYVTLAPTQRCELSLGREQRVRELWSLALRGAGAGSVVFTNGPVSPTDAQRLTPKTGRTN